MRIGVLAVQGGFGAHCRMLERLGHTPSEVRCGAELVDLEGLILPGGESTAQRLAIEREGMVGALKAFVATGRPVLATCAGLILASRSLGYGFVDVLVDRNAWGAQVDSFEAESDHGRPLVFIRAPRIYAVGPSTLVLDTYLGEPVLVRQGAVVGATFHPELTADTSVHSRCFSPRPAEAMRTAS